jgi:hypothetical protein
MKATTISTPVKGSGIREVTGETTPVLYPPQRRLFYRTAQRPDGKPEVNMVKAMMQAGQNIDLHHHEVATAVRQRWVCLSVPWYARQIIF